MLSASPTCTIVRCLRWILFHHTAPLYRAVMQCDLPSLLVIASLAIPSSSMSCNTIPLSSVGISKGMLVQYNLFLFCAENKLLFIVTGLTPRYFVIMSCESCFIGTFSIRKYLGFSLSFSLTNSKNSLLRGSSKSSCLPATLKP